MIQKHSTDLREQVLSNGAYKFVALVAAVILWLTVLGRKEVVSLKELALNIDTAPNIVAHYDTSLKLKIRVKGRRKLVKEFNEIDFPLTISLKGRGAGVYSVPLTAANIHIPVGLRVLSISPRNLQVDLKIKENYEQGK